MTDITLLSNLQIMMVFSLLFLSFNLLLVQFGRVPRKIAAMTDKNKARSTHAEFISSITAFAHAVASFALSLYILMEDGITKHQKNTFPETALLSLSAGYFFSDTITGIIYEFNNKMMNAHHVLVIVNVLYIFEYRQYANITVAALFASEASNPFRQIELIAAQLTNTQTITKFCRIAFAFVFVFCR